MQEWLSLKNRFGYRDLFVGGKLNESFVEKLDNFFLGKTQCLEYGDKKRIQEYLEYADTGVGSEEIENFDKELGK